jgi:thiol-disulfide isomerase/thioredoxin
MKRLCAVLVLLGLALAWPTRAVAKSVRVLSQAELAAERARHKGRVLVVHIWATWCEACVAELALVARLAREAKSRGIDFLPLALDDPRPQSAAHVARLLKAKTGDADWSSILDVADSDALIADLDSRWEGEIPAFFVFDSQGRLRRTLIGNITRASFEGLVGDLSTPNGR